MIDESRSRGDMKFRPDRKSIDLKIEEGVYPEGRKVLDEDGNEITANEPRAMVDLSDMDGVADVKFLHYGSGKFEPEGLKYLKTEPLGACVALTLWHPESKIGIIAHFAITNNAASGTSIVFDKIRDAGLNPSSFQARLFGGSNENDDSKARSQRLVQDIWQKLSDDSVPLLETDLYGANVRCTALNLEGGEACDYPYEEASTTKNDTPVDNVKMPIRSLPKLPNY